MLEELRTFDKLGTKSDLEYFLFNALSTSETQRLSSLVNHCLSAKFSISYSLQGILKFLEYLSFISIDNEFVSINKNIFNPEDYVDAKSYFETKHFYDGIFNYLKSIESLDSVLNKDNVKLHVNKKQYFVKENLIKSHAVNIKNLLLSLGFLCRDEKIQNHLFVNTLFTALIEELISYISDKSRRKKNTLLQLKDSFKAKEEAGYIGERFALEYERKLLSRHVNINNIKIISDNYVDAGYDIESFVSLESVFNDKFIEVKSYSGDDAYFYWTKNEIKVAKLLKSKYYLYIINRDEIDDDSYEPIVICNPSEFLFNTDSWNIEPEVLKVTKLNN